MKPTVVLKPDVPESARAQFPEMNPIVLRMCWNRGLQTQLEIDEFLYPDYARDINDPMLFAHMPLALDRIHAAIARNERITIHGDYDADGVCASAILKTTLEQLGATVDVFLPDREKDGYGLNSRTVQYLAEQGTKLIITVDCGISNKPEIDLAKSLGVDTIVTDHHTQPLELPEQAVAIIHPHVAGETYPFKGLAGGAVAWKLAHALILADNGKHIAAGFEKWLLDLASISTVADVMSLTGENRTIVKYGLIVMRKTRWQGLRELLRAANVDPQKVTATDIAFRLGPRINAAGRIDHSNRALDLLMARRPSDAVQFAAQLERTNAERGKLTQVMMEEAEAQLTDQADEAILIAISDTWRTGLLGLVAGRIMEKTRKPALIMTRARGDITGSGRSPGTLNLVKSLQSADHLLGKYGGHPPAAGFSLDPENFDAFVTHMRSVAREATRDGVPQHTIEVEAELKFSDIDWALSDELANLEPFGAGNPEPLFLTRGVEIIEARAVGTNQKHGKFVLKADGKTIPAIGFGHGESATTMSAGQTVDVVYQISVNEWNGNRELQCVIKDLGV